MGRSKKPLPKAKDGVGDLGQFRNLCAVSICVIAVGIVVMALPDASPKPTPSANASGTELSMYDPNRTGCENVFRLTDVFQLTHMLRLTHGSKRRVTEGEFQQAMANATRLLAEGQCVLIKDTWKAQYHWASFIKSLRRCVVNGLLTVYAGIILPSKHTCTRFHEDMFQIDH